jgi:hypothetical protein
VIYRDRVDDSDPRLEGSISEVLCGEIATMIVNKAQRLAIDDDLIDKLHAFLKRFGIPTDQLLRLPKPDRGRLGGKTMMSVNIKFVI